MGIIDSYKALDDAVSAHLKESTGSDAVFPTGWVLVSSVSSMSHDEENSDGYMTFTSDGLPYHSHVGLLEVAMEDRRNSGLLSAIQSAIGYDDEDGM